MASIKILAGFIMMQTGILISQNLPLCNRELIDPDQNRRITITNDETFCVKTVEKLIELNQWKTALWFSRFMFSESTMSNFKIYFQSKIIYINSLFNDISNESKLLENTQNAKSIFTKPELEQCIYAYYLYNFGQKNSARIKYSNLLENSKNDLAKIKLLRELNFIRSNSFVNTDQTLHSWTECFPVYQVNDIIDTQLSIGLMFEMSSQFRLALTYYSNAYKLMNQEDIFGILNEKISLCRKININSQIDTFFLSITNLTFKLSPFNPDGLFQEIRNIREYCINKNDFPGASIFAKSQKILFHYARNAKYKHLIYSADKK